MMQVSEAGPKVAKNNDGSLDELFARAKAEGQAGVAAIGEIEYIAIVKHPKSESWTMILEDVSGEGRWRCQSFDANGFSGHMVFNSKDEAIRNAAMMRFTVRDDGALDRIQDTQSFQAGMYSIEQIALFNRGEIEFSEYLARTKAYRAHLEQVAVH